MTVEWPDRRADVLNGFDALAAEPVLNDQGNDQRWPDITNAAHWVVDDTGWDMTDPAESVGTLLSDDAEAEAVGRVVALIVEVSQRVGAEATDDAWCSDATWPAVRQAASQAAGVLRRNQR